MNFGLWTPGSCPAHASEPLLDIAMPLECPAGSPDGHMYAGCIVGQLGSSTRAEIAGGIAALLQPIPVHVGTDHEAFLSRASQILENPETQPRKPFALQRDGDFRGFVHPARR